jgi:hypothetical protein
VHHLRAGSAKWQDCRRGFVLTCVGGLVGSLVVQLCNPELLKRFIPIMLLAVAAYVLLRPKFGEADIHPRMTPERFDWVFGLGLGFYDGFFGPGTGTFYVMAFALALGFNLTKATAHTKVMNFASNIASLAVFVALRQVWLVAGLVMGAGQWAGARLGSRMVLRGGVKFIRPIFIAMVIALALKLLWNAFR